MGWTTKFANSLSDSDQKISWDYTLKARKIGFAAQNHIIVACGEYHGLPLWKEIP